MKIMFLLPLIIGCNLPPGNRLVWSHREVLSNYDTLQKNLWCPMEIKSGGYNVVSIDGEYIPPPK